MRKRGEQDKTQNFVKFVQNIDEAALETVETGIMTGGFALIRLKMHFGYKKHQIWQKNVSQESLTKLSQEFLTRMLLHKTVLLCSLEKTVWARSKSLSVLRQ